jgi:hypothetical protein
MLYRRAGIALESLPDIARRAASNAPHRAMQPIVDVEGIATSLLADGNKAASSLVPLAVRWMIRLRSEEFFRRVAHARRLP